MAEHKISSKQQQSCWTEKNKMEGPLPAEWRQQMGAAGLSDPKMPQRGAALKQDVRCSASLVKLMYFSCFYYRKK